MPGHVGARSSSRRDPLEQSIPIRRGSAGLASMVIVPGHDDMAVLPCFFMFLLSSPPSLLPSIRQAVLAQCASLYHPPSGQEVSGMSSHSRSLSTQPLLSLLGIKSEPWTPLPTSEKEAADQTKLGNAPSWYRQRAGEWPTLRSSGTRTGRSVILLAVVLALLLAHASRTARSKYILSLLMPHLPWVLRRSVPTGPILRPSTVQRDDALTFDEFLRRHFDPASTVPFLILVDGEYAPMARAAELRMHELNLIEGAPTRPVSSSSTNETALSARSSSGRVKHPLVVLCSDEVCLDYATSRGMYAYGGYAVSTVPGGGRTGSVTEQEVVSRKGLMPWIKFSALRDVTQAGWNTVWTEGDVFLHGDPFKYMLRLEGEPRWDVQIACASRPIPLVRFG